MKKSPADTHPHQLETTIRHIRISQTGPLVTVSKKEGPTRRHTAKDLGPPVVTQNWADALRRLAGQGPYNLS